MASTVLLLGLTGCASNSEVSRPDEMTVVGHFLRWQPPDEVQVVDGSAVLVPESLDDVWPAWRRVETVPEPVPHVEPDTGQVVLVWFGYERFEVTGYRIDDEHLVIEGRRELPGHGCVTLTVVTGVTVVVAIDDERVTPGMPTAPVEYETVTFTCP